MPVELPGGIDASSDYTVNNFTVNGTLTVTSGLTSLVQLTQTGKITVTVQNSNALAVGRAGETNPALQVDSATALSATGIKVTAAAAAGGVAIAAISSGTNESVTIDAKGSGTLTLNGTATGAVTIGNQLNVDNLRLDGNTLSSTNLNGDITLTPNGSGRVSTSASFNSSAAGGVFGMFRFGSNGMGFHSVSDGIGIDDGANRSIGFSPGNMRLRSGDIIGWTDSPAESFTGQSLLLSRPASGTLGVGGALFVTSAAAAAFVVGPNGATNPTLSLVCNVVSQVTGLSIAGAATGGTTALAVTDSGPNASLSINAKGSGTVTINGTATGAVTIGNQLNVDNLRLDGNTLSSTSGDLSLSGTGNVNAGPHWYFHANGALVSGTGGNGVHLGGSFGAEGYSTIRSAGSINFKIGTDAGENFRFSIAGGAELSRLDYLANFGIKQSSFGTNAAGVLAQGNGTAPTTFPADCFQMYSFDQAAGNACPHIYTENGALIKLYRTNTYIQTYGTATLTHSNFTSADLGAFSGGAIGFLDAAERDNVRTQFNALRADLANLKQVVNQMIDDDQLTGFKG